MYPNNYVDCIFCDTQVPVINQDPAHASEPCEVIPYADDDDAWAELARYHHPWCEWIITRAHQL